MRHPVEDSLHQPQRFARFLRAILLVGVAISAAGCGGSSGPTSGPAAASIDERVRALPPAELMKLILAGETACGGEEELALVRAAYWLKRGDYHESLKYAAEVAPDGPHRAAALWIAGESLFRTGDLAQALRILTTLAAEFPDDLECRRCLAALYFDMSAMHEAEIELQQVMRLAPGDFRPHHLLGRIRLDFEKFSLAVEEYREALRLCPESGPRLELRRGLADALRGDRQYDEILRTVSATDEDPVLQTFRADALWSTGQPEEARRVLDGVLQRVPDLVETLRLSARIDAELGRPDRAVEQLQRLLEADPHDVRSRYQLAQVQRQQGQTEAFQETMRLKDASQALVDRLVELNKQAIDRPGDPDLCRQIADVCQQLGKHRLAESWRRTADGLSQSRPAAASAPSSNTSPPELPD